MDTSIKGSTLIVCFLKVFRLSRLSFWLGTCRCRFVDSAVSPGVFTILGLGFSVSSAHVEVESLGKSVITRIILGALVAYGSCVGGGVGFSLEV